MRNYSDFDPACSFCQKFSVRDDIAKKWYDKELTESRGFVVVPGVGAFIEGYLLIVPRRHYRALAEIETTTLNHLIAFKEEVTQVLSNRYKSPILFEHGTGLKRAGSCLEHAHLHAIPFPEELAEFVEAGRGFRRVTDMLELRTIHGPEGYLYFETPKGHSYATAATGAPSQYFRRIIAAAVGKQEYWDYAAFPFYESVRSTIAKLSPWPQVTR